MAHTNARTTERITKYIEPYRFSIARAMVMRNKAAGVSARVVSTAHFLAWLELQETV